MANVPYQENSTWRTSFAKVVASGVDTEYFNIVGSVGSGMAVSQSAGNLVLTSGTTANAETLIRSTRSFKGALTLREMTTLSQRIANNNFEVALVDVVGDALPFTINSATSVTVKLPSSMSGRFDAGNVGQYMSIGVPNLAGAIAGRYAIASVDTNANTLTFTVASWPSSGSGTLSLYGWNYHRILYAGTTETSANVDSQRNGWNSGDSTITINTTASPGHVAICNVEDGVVSWSDQVVATSTVLQQTVRGSRVQNIPSDTVGLFLQIRATNGTTSPASTTTMTVGFVSVEQYDPCDVSIRAVRPQSFNHALPVVFPTAPSVSLTGTTNSIQGQTSHDGAISGSPIRVGARAVTTNYTAVSSGDAADLVSTLVGALITKPYSIPENDWTYAAASGGIVNTTDVAIKAAAGAGIRNYLTGMDIRNSHASVATEVVIKDGSTVIWRGQFNANSGMTNVVFETPLKSTANTALNAACITTGASVYVNARGYVAP